MSSQLKRKTIAGNRLSLLHEMFVLFYGVRDKRTPLYAKLAACAALFYLLSPIDLIPDFIPIAGWLDDLVIVPFILHIAFKLLPADVKTAGWNEAKKHLIMLRIGVAVLVVFAVAVMTGIFFLIKGNLTS